MLVIAGILASLALWATGESLNGRMLGTARQVQLRATGLTEAGLAAARTLLVRDPLVESATWNLPANVDSGGSVAVNTRRVLDDHLPPGFSAGRFNGYQHEIAATGTAPQGARARRVQGVMVIHPVPDSSPVLQVIAQGEPASARLEVADSGATLRLVRTDTGMVIWSGGTGASAQQLIFDAASRFAGSYLGLDTNADGLHDRIYAGDLAGRLWRLELHNGAPAANFAAASLFADLSAVPGESGGGHRFSTPPDISLQRDQSGEPWLLIAIGTASPGGGNRLYLLRDDGVRPGDGNRTASAAPAKAADLQPYSSNSASGGAGYYVDLGQGQALAPSVTTRGNVSISIARAPLAADGTALLASTTLAGAVALAQPASAEVRLADPIWADAGRAPANQGFGVRLDAAGTAIHCSLAGQDLQTCSAPVPVLGLYWRREDAD